MWHNIRIQHDRGIPRVSSSRRRSAAESKWKRKINTAAGTYQYWSSSEASFGKKSKVWKRNFVEYPEFHSHSILECVSPILCLWYGDVFTTVWSHLRKDLKKKTEQFDYLVSKNLHTRSKVMFDCKVEEYKERMVTLTSLLSQNDNVTENQEDQNNE